jgi:Intracellular proteinase inhibitor
MRGGFSLLVSLCLMTGNVFSQGVEPRDTPGAASSGAQAAAPLAGQPAAVPAATPKPPKRGFMSRVLHPFSGSAKAATPLPVKDPKLRGLTLDLQVSPQPVKLSEVRQLSIKATLTNKGKRGIELDFQSDQRIEIYLMNTAEVVLTKWSDNHAIKETSTSVLINQQERIEYNETIATRELAPDKVYIAEVFFPKYPELRARQKFLTAR